MPQETVGSTALTRARFLEYVTSFIYYPLYCLCESAAAKGNKNNLNLQQKTFLMWSEIMGKEAIVD
jgi:hypothetical protein